MKEMRSRGHSISLFALCQPKDFQYIDEVAKTWAHATIVPVENTLERRARSLLGSLFQTSARSYCLSVDMNQHARVLLRARDFDVIHIFHPFLIRIIADELPPEKRRLTRLVGDVHDVSTMVLRRKLRAQPSLRVLMDLFWMSRSEYADFAQAARLIVYSPSDEADLAKNVRPSVPMNRMPMWFDAIDQIRLEAGTRSASQELLVVGNSGDPRMRTSVAWLLRWVWPVIHARFPSARLRLVSVRKEHQAQWAAVPGVVVSPYVDNLVDLYDQSAALLFPLLSGGFSRHLKILTAMARGCPIVMTQEANTAQGLVDGVDAAICATPDEFVAAIARLLSDPSYGQILAEAALRRIQQDYRALDIISELEWAYLDWPS